MTFSGDHLEERSHWSKTRSRVVLSLIVLFFLILLIDSQSRGYALVGLGLMATIMLHEAGHFIAARWANMKATEFFVGFGPRIWSFKKGETEYGIKAIPLGGYVKIIGMTNLEEVHEDDEHRTYRRGHTLKKLVVILAGVTVNFILAYVLIFASLVGHGVPKDEKNAKAIIESVDLGSAANKAGIKPNDKIVEFDGVKIKTFDILASEIKKQKVGDKVSVTIERDSKTLTKNVTLASGLNADGSKTNKPVLGIVRISEYEKVDVVTASKDSGVAVINVIKASSSGVTRLFSVSGLKRYSKTVVEGDFERQDRPSSPAGIVDIGGQLVNQDIWTLLWLMAFINVFLGLLNLVPMLPLDGGHAVVAIYEGIASKIMKRRVQANFKILVPFASVFVGAVLLLSLTTLWLDILQIAS